ncbi:hypothetical protein, partial [Pseudomonas lopnurensis]|uniref:hypothetical protein n=1 Tax=Pseudomonas lopnurensis TaxID=1477517 RepID=UPI001A9C46BE
INRVIHIRGVQDVAQFRYAESTFWWAADSRLSALNKAVGRNLGVIVCLGLLSTKIVVTQGVAP